MKAYLILILSLLSLPAMADKQENYNSIEELSVDLREIFKADFPKISKYVRTSWPENNSDRTDEELFVGTNCAQASDILEHVLQEHGYAPIIEKTNRHNYLSIQVNIKGIPTDVIVDPTWKQLFAYDVHNKLIKQSGSASTQNIDKTIVAMKADSLLVQKRSNLKNYIESQESNPVWKISASNDSFKDWYFNDPIKLDPKNLLKTLNLNYNRTEKEYPGNEKFWKNARDDFKENGTNAVLNLCDPRTSTDLYHSIYNTLDEYASKEAEELDQLLKNKKDKLSLDDEYEILSLKSEIAGVEKNVTDIDFKNRMIKSRKRMLSHFRLARKILQSNVIPKNNFTIIESDLLTARKKLTSFIEKTQFSDETKKELINRINNTELVIPKNINTREISKFRASVLADMKKNKVDFDTAKNNKENEDPAEHALLDFSASGGQIPQISIGFLASTEIYQNKFKIDYQSILAHELGHNIDPTFNHANLTEKLSLHDREIFNNVKKCLMNRYSSEESGKTKEHEDFADLIGQVSQQQTLMTGQFSQQNIDDDLNETIRSICAPQEEFDNYAKEGVRRLRSFLYPNIRKAYGISAPVEELIKEEECGKYFFNPIQTKNNSECVGENLVAPVLNDSAKKLIESAKHLPGLIKD
jgi:hypothetical protein